MTQISHSESFAVRSSCTDYYLILLGGLLMGYAVFGKTFANVGVTVPPLYIGELVFAMGAIAFFHSRCAIAIFASLPNLLLLILISWAVVRTVPYVGEFGMDAFRDAVILVYGGFAFIVAALLLEKPERLTLIIKFLRGLGLVLIPLTPILVLMTNASAHSDAGPQWHIAQVKIGTAGVHLGAAALLVLLGFKRPGLMWLVLLIIGTTAVATQNRGGMLAMMFMLTVGALASGKLREFGVTLLVGAALIAVAYAFDLSIPTARHERDISVVQLVGNLKSLVGGGRDDLAGTSAWRLQWWNTIINYTINGPYFWAGKGFGINLAIADGTISGRDNGLIPLTRSPHNGNFTILARTGVIGLGLWLLTFAAWSVAMLRDMLRARARADKAWANFFLLVFCYAGGFLIDASFDVTLEGPMAGIWFWCVFGVGSGASMIYRAAPERRSAREFAGSMRSANMAECESRLVRRRLDMIS